MDKKGSYAGHLAMLSANVIWGLCAPIGKSALNFPTVTPMALTTFRMVGAAVLFWLLSCFTGREPVCKKDRMRLFFAALFAIVFNQGSFIFGLGLTSPISASIVTTTLPIVTMLVAAIWLKEPITGKKAGGILIGASGALLLILGRSDTLGGGSNSLLGNLFCLIAQCSFAVYLTAFKGLIVRYSSVTLLRWMFLYASICFLPFSFDYVWAIDYASLPLPIWSDIFFVVFFATFVSYLCIPLGQKRLRPTVVSMYNYVQPVVASVSAIALGLDRFDWIKMVAVVLVFGGVYIVTRSKSREQLEAERAGREQA